MMLTIETLFNDPNIVSAVIDRVQQTHTQMSYTGSSTLTSRERLPVCLKTISVLLQG